MSFIALTRVMAEGSGDAFGGLGINTFLVIAQIVNFVFLILFLNGLLIKPLMRGLDNRRLRIEESLENARKADERLANVEKDYEARLSEATVEAQKMRAEMLQNAQAEVERIRKDAAAEAERIKTRARIDAAAERNQMLADLRTQVAALAIAAANKIIGESLDEQRQQVLVKDFFSKVPVTVMSSIAVAGPSQVTVTSALPLSADEQARVQADLTRQLGEVLSIEFDVDPGILGGLVVRVGDKIIDGSVAGRLSSLRQQLNA